MSRPLSLGIVGKDCSGFWIEKEKTRVIVKDLGVEIRMAARSH